MPVKTIFKAVTVIILQTNSGLFSALFVRLHGFKHGFVKWLKWPSAFRPDKPSCCSRPLVPSHTSSVNPDDRVEIHIGSRMDSTRASGVCVGSLLGIIPESRHQGLLTQTWPFAQNPRNLPGSLSASHQHHRSPSRFTAPWRKRGGGWGEEEGALSSSCSQWS